MLTIAVCDDNPASVENFMTVLKNYLAEIGLEYNIDIYDDEVKLLTRIMSGSKYDIYVCDIEMPIQGDRLISEVRHYDTDFLLAFVSNYRDMGNIVCRARGDIYIYKSMGEDMMRHEIKHLFKLYFNNKKVCTLRTASGLIDVEVRKVKYIESRKREVIVHILNGKDFTILDQTLSSLEHDSAFSCFSRVGRSYLINFQGVKAVGKNIQFSDGEELQFSTEKIKDFRSKWLDFQLEEMK